MEHVPFYALKGSPVNESPLGLFDTTKTARSLEERVRHPAPLPAATSCRPWAVKRLHEFDGDIRKFRVVKRYPSVLRQIGDRQDRAGRRKQPGHLLAGRQGRHPQAGDYCAGRSGRLQLFRRPVPGQPGPARIRRDVQGADQGAAPAADRHAGRQLQGHRRLRRDPVQRRRSWRTRTSRNGRPSATTRTTRRSSTASTSSRCRTACAYTEEVKIYEKLLRNSSLAEAPCAPGHARR